MKKKKERTNFFGLINVRLSVVGLESIVDRQQYKGSQVIKSESNSSFKCVFQLESYLFQKEKLFFFLRADGLEISQSNGLP